MNILHVSTTDLGGSRFNGYGMMQGGDRGGCHFEMTVWRKESADPRVHQLKKGWLWVLNAVMARLSDAIAGEGWVTPASFALPAQECFKNADIVHLQLIHNGTLFSLAPLPWLNSS